MHRILAFLAVATLVATTASAQVQRMMLRPGVHSIGKSGTKITARCLDADRLTPPVTHSFTKGADVTVRVAKGGATQSASLDDAIARGWVEVRGTGDYSSVQFKALVDGEVSLDVGAAGVLGRGASDVSAAHKALSSPTMAETLAEYRVTRSKLDAVASKHPNLKGVLERHDQEFAWRHLSAAESGSSKSPDYSAELRSLLRAPDGVTARGDWFALEHGVVLKKDDAKIIGEVLGQSILPPTRKYKRVRFVEGEPRVVEPNTPGNGTRLEASIDLSGTEVVLENLPSHKEMEGAMRALRKSNVTFVTDVRSAKELLASPPKTPRFILVGSTKPTTAGSLYTHAPPEAVTAASNQASASGWRVVESKAELRSALAEVLDSERAIVVCHNERGRVPLLGGSYKLSFLRKRADVVTCSSYKDGVHGATSIRDLDLGTVVSSLTDAAKVGPMTRLDIRGAVQLAAKQNPLRTSPSRQDVVAASGATISAGGLIYAAWMLADDEDDEDDEDTDVSNGK